MKQKSERFLKLKIPITQALKAQQAYPDLSMTQAVIQQLTINNQAHKRGKKNEPTAGS